MIVTILSLWFQETLVDIELQKYSHPFNFFTFLPCYHHKLQRMLLGFYVTD